MLSRNAKRSSKSTLQSSRSLALCLIPHSTTLVLSVEQGYFLCFSGCILGLLFGFVVAVGFFLHFTEY